MTGDRGQVTVLKGFYCLRFICWECSNSLVYSYIAGILVWIEKFRAKILDISMFLSWGSRP
ncbi:hypothetical protein B6N60_02578 [Richelia sinica FACHB-800]|uniref:Uncharacterized protein n=1 Tax=Richelia sinica FACHB-800 TaxID=1357546 RepID=A0A975T9D3_9NOST|nr:hypothetical protein B6N60_02578 [Richelia sinica FACHB-800]